MGLNTYLMALRPPIVEPILDVSNIDPTASVDQVLATLRDLKFTPVWEKYFTDLNTLALNLVQEQVMSNIQGPYSASSNITADLYGVADTRPGTWGFTDFADNNIVFAPPAGMRTRILQVYGNYYAMPKVVEPGVSPAPVAGGFTGLLWGFLTTAPGGSDRANPVADDCMAFYQAGMNGTDPIHFEFDFDIGKGVTPANPTMGLLEADNILVNRMASFLNTLAVPLHMEAQYTIIYQFEQA